MFKTRPARVHVLGAGPAGLLVAHAAKMMGIDDVRIYSAPDEMGDVRKSPLHGCQYLHRHIIGVTQRTENVLVRYTLQGTVEDYRTKVYGPNYDGSVSPDEYGPEASHHAWDLREAYERLWKRWYPSMMPCLASPDSVWQLTQDKRGLVVSTIPVPALCQKRDEHKFVTQNVWAIGQSDTQQVPLDIPPNTVLCNGEPWTGWYRAARVFGYSTMEWPGGKKPPLDGIVKVEKPLRTDCDCHVGERFLRAGRYGEWTKGVLVHEAYEKVYEALR